MLSFFLPVILVTPALKGVDDRHFTFAKVNTDISRALQFYTSAIPKSY